MSDGRDTPIPTLESFLAAPASTVASVAPATIVLAPGGTRREAALHGVSLQDYFGWSTDRLIDRIERIALLGVRDVFVSIVRSTQAAESGSYGQQLWTAANTILGDPTRIARIAQANLQVRTFGAADFPRIADMLRDVTAATKHCTGTRWWWMFSSSANAPWEHALRAIVSAGATNRAAAVQAVYGIDVAPVGIYLAFGKPYISPELLPPLLDGDTTALWYQQPGYDGLTDSFLRRVFYEAAYMRRTWHADKTKRYADVPTHKSLWNQPLVLGLGHKVGTFWYPEYQAIDSAE